MATRDLMNRIHVARLISPAAATTDNTAYVSAIVDRANFDACEFVGIFGSVADADATFTVLVEDGDASNLSDAAAVPDAQLLGVEAMSLRYDSDNKVWKIGYIGTKRYVRVTVTPAANTGNIFLAGVWLLGSPRSIPQSTQVV
jgi:hypothetical protein